MKKVIFILALFSGLILFITSCNEDDGVCVSSTGKIITEDRGNQSFNRILVYDNINLILTQDSSINNIKVEAGENLIRGISTEIDSGKLVLRNTNTCNWLRSFEVPVNVYLTVMQLDTIAFRAAGNISCTNTLKGYSFTLEVIEGSGDIDLALDVYRSYINVRYGTTDIRLSGNSDVTTLISYGFGPLHAEDLKSEFTYVSSYSPNDMFVFASIDLTVELGNVGNVYYRGNPGNIYTNIHGEGRVIEF
jgi:hypothetical protein